MQRDLIFDTETTGKWNFKAGVESPKQPNIVQLAMRLVQGDRSLFTVSMLASDCGTVEAEAKAVHGIEPDRCLEEGFKTITLITIFKQIARSADRIIAHNAEFDRRVMTRAFMRYLDVRDMPEKPYFCTMKSLTNYLKLPGKFGKPKWPTLREAYAAFNNGVVFDGAHDALADVDACWNLVRGCASRDIPLLPFTAKV